jgi:N-acetylneuraminic acid mutarotase
VWTGSEMIVWGGSDLSGRLITGARYNPTANSWTAVATNGAPTARLDPTVVWTGSEMIVWGGSSLPGSDFLNTGARYNPTANSWTAVTTSGAPVARTYHTAVWTGSEMIVWGGQGGGSRNDGGRYNPTANSWTAVTTSGAPTGRYEHTAVWTGSKMIVWGGYGPTGRTNDGGIYDPTVNNWTSVATTGAPTGRTGHTAVWTGNEMIVWGGNTSPGSGFLNTGGGYDPTANSWMAVNAGRAPAARNGHTAEWTGSEMIVWGGVNVEGATSHYLNDTFSYTTSRGLYLYQRP